MAPIKTSSSRQGGRSSVRFWRMALPCPRQEWLIDWVHGAVPTLI